MGDMNRSPSPTLGPGRLLRSWDELHEERKEKFWQQDELLDKPGECQHFISRLC